MQEKLRDKDLNQALKVCLVVEYILQIQSPIQKSTIQNSNAVIIVNLNVGRLKTENVAHHNWYLQTL